MMLFLQATSQFHLFNLQFITSLRKTMREDEAFERTRITSGEYSNTAVSYNTFTPTLP